MSSPDVWVAALRVEHDACRLGMGEPSPRLSWEVSAPSDWRQSGYEIEASATDGAVRTALIDSDASVLVDWPFLPLTSRERVDLRVRVVGASGAPSEWSDPIELEAGLLERADWAAKRIGPAWSEAPGQERRPPLLRREFSIDSSIATARLYVTGEGMYEVELNGERIGDEALAPGLTDYSKRLSYSTFDVAAQLRPGQNVIGVRMADGWFRGRYGARRDNWGSELALILQLEMVLADGRRLVISSDQDWTATVGGILSSSLYDGESFDAREEIPGWSQPGPIWGEWAPVRVRDLPDAALVAPVGPPVRATEHVAPVASWTSPSGATILDFGQNLVGRLSVRLTGPSGATVSFRHAEVLENGELCMRTLRTAEATDIYVLSGGSPADRVEEWEPRFTLHGFRYVEVRDDDDAVSLVEVAAVVYHSDMRRIGTFTSSNPELNRLHDNIEWSLRGNFVSIPTDCPQRDERYGWTGDIQLFSPTASFLFDCSGFLASWLRDLALDQTPDGSLPWMVPVFGLTEAERPELFEAAALWGDAAVLVPWALYQHFGDVGVLRDQYPSAKAWIDHVDRLVGESHVWDRGHQFGDWLDPTAPPDAPDEGSTDKGLVATAYFAYSSRRLGETAAILGLDSDAERYSSLSSAAAAAFRARYADRSGRLASDSQTAYSLALVFDLYADALQREWAQQRLASLVEESGRMLGTGLAGTNLICDALTDAGRIDLAYSLLLQENCPSWLYTVRQGATTIWERWDSIRPDGSVNPGEMTSFNHYALGAIGDWMHRNVAGLSPMEPGYRRILFRPRPGGGIRSASASHETPYGLSAISWDCEHARIRVSVEVPVGTTALIVFPNGSSAELVAGEHDFDLPLKND